MKASELQRLIVERRERCWLAGQFTPICKWLFQQHGVIIDAKTCEALYIAAKKAKD